MAAAKEGFARLGDKHLDLALRYTNAVPENKPKPIHKLEKALALMQWAVKAWAPFDCALKAWNSLAYPRPSTGNLCSSKI